MSLAIYPLSPVDELKSLYLNKPISQVPTPAALLDVAKVRHSCKLMLDAVEGLGLSFRAHIKTHKTLELTKFQVGEHSNDVRLIVSTVMEAEQVVPLLQHYRAQGAKVNLLYGVPIGPSQVRQLADVGKRLGSGSMTFMIDHEQQLSSVEAFKELTSFPAAIFLKTDSGYHRAGLHPLSNEMQLLVEQVGRLEDKNGAQLLGFYSHNSLSYGGSSPDEAMGMLKVEISVCQEASQHLASARSTPLILSVGASPTALSIQNILPGTSLGSSSAKTLKDALDLITSVFELEIHAGVYPLFDLQQVAASSRNFKGDPHDTIAISVLAEVCSLYPKRTEKPEALISAGCLALGREPCKSYPGWGVVSPWKMPSGYSHIGHDRIIVSRISQEHGILARESSSKEELPLEYGQLVRIWPNHACIAMAMFGWYFIVDSVSPDPDQIIDIWARWRGW
jgi:D-serine ammonia-lyase